MFQSEKNGGWACIFGKGECYYKHEKRSAADYTNLRPPEWIKKKIKEGVSPNDVPSVKDAKAEIEARRKGEPVPKKTPRGKSPSGDTRNQKPPTSALGAGTKEECPNKLCEDKACLATKNHKAMNQSLYAKALLVKKAKANTATVGDVKSYGTDSTQDCFSLDD